MRGAQYMDTDSNLPDNCNYYIKLWSIKMSYELNEARELVLMAGHKLVENGLIARTWGNISARISDTQFVITPSGRSYDSLIPEDIVIVNISDLSYEGEIKPSGEMATHAEVYKARADIDFVVHTHQRYASAISVMGSDIEDIDSYNQLLKDTGHNYTDILGDCVPCGEYAISSSEALAKKVRATLKRVPECSALLMRHHGVVCMGKTYEDAFLVSTALEEISESYYHYLTQYFLEEFTCTPAYNFGYSKRCDDMILLSVNESVINWETGHPKELQKMNVDPVLCALAILHDTFYHNPDINYVEYVSDEYTDIISNLNKTIRPYIDDQAQIIGTRLKCVNPKFKDGILRNPKSVAQAMEGCNAMLMSTGGAICIGSSEDDINAAAMVLEKGCMAAVLAHLMNNIKAVPDSDVKKMREIYKNSYSKLKDTEITAARILEVQSALNAPVPDSIKPPIGDAVNVTDK